MSVVLNYGLQFHVPRMIKAGRKYVIGPEGTEAAGEADPADILRHSVFTFSS